uniref:VWFC domain-containing protein n=1 Tax=Naja naja TaxID=35670 RepID=A0A8C7E6Q2_NAJNA
RKEGRKIRERERRRRKEGRKEGRERERELAQEIQAPPSPAQKSRGYSPSPQSNPDPSLPPTPSAGCMHEGQDRADGSSWFPPSKPCQACLCADGIVTCTQILCVSSCPAQVEVPGECCPVCAGTPGPVLISPSR